jgi:tetratricopeptide (TPR) repeat protein
MKCLLIAILLAGSALAQTAPDWASPAESDIGLAASNEKDPSRQLDLLRKWEQQYPSSAFRGKRELMVAQAQFKILQAAYTKTDSVLLAAGQKAGQDLEMHFAEYFDDANKPADVTPDQWAAARRGTESQAHLILAYIAGVQKNDHGAEDELKKVLEVDPNQAIASYQLGLTILHEMSASNDLSRYPEALYDLARSLQVTGPTALTPQVKNAADASLKKQYAHYHGSAEGLDQLLRQTASAALPAADFQLLSIDQIDAAKQRDHDVWAKDHPDLAFWETIRTALQTQGDTFFSTLQGVAFPPEGSDAYHGPAMFRGTVVSMPSPKQILVNVDSAAGDAILQFDDAIRGEIPAGGAIQFKGVVNAWTKGPYTLTLAIQEPKTDLTGLPEGVKFGPAPKTPARPAARSGAKGRGKSR